MEQHNQESVLGGIWCYIVEYIARNEALKWGKLCTGSVGISGTDYEPPIPEKKKATDELNSILNDANISATDKALKAFTWGTRWQFLYDNAIHGIRF